MAQQCAPTPSAKPSPKPCAPAPCPKPCPPKPCKPCPPVCFEGGYPDEQCCFPPAYNQPANFNLGPCPWDFWIDLSFTYWDAEQEGLDLAISSRSVIDGDSATSNSPDSGKFLFQDTQFKPGFKVGIGMDLEHDAWSGFAEYTWFRSTTNTHQSAPADPAGDTPVWNLSNWFVKDSTTSNITSIASNINSKWRLRMDLLDAGLIRPYYQGTHLIVAPFGGLRGQWIRQNLSITGDFPTSNVTPDLTATSSNKSNSWAVGPRAGCLGKWHLGWGIRLEGDVAASLVFTRYTSVKHSEGATTLTASPVAASLKNYNCLRAVNEMNLGLGWGSYFDCRNYHFDLLATYDFQVFWNQNVLRQLVDSLESGTGHAPSNLYLQGLTIKAQFDF
jgi:hypothetical protein